MLSLKRSIAENIAKKLVAAYPAAEMSAPDIADMLEYPPDSKMGDLALPCFKLSKTLRNAPPRIAAALAEGFECEGVESAEALGGYFNLKISNKYLEEKVLPEILDKKEKYGAPSIGEGKTVVLD